MNLLHLALKESNLVGQAVDVNDLTGLLDDGGHVNTNDVLGAGTSSEPVQILSVAVQKNGVGLVLTCSEYQYHSRHRGQPCP